MNTLTLSPNHRSQPIATKSTLHATREAVDHPSEASRLSDLLQGVVEGLIDGVMLVTSQGELIHANSCAQRICRQLSQNSSRNDAVPQQIWRKCQALLRSRELFPNRAVIVEDEIELAEGNMIRIRVRWLDQCHLQRSCLLIALEDQRQSAQYRAIAEAHKFGLTDRETEVWLLKRANYKYKQIAASLHIAEDTVKKHIKSIHAKRDALQWAGEN